MRGLFRGRVDSAKSLRKTFLDNERHDEKEAIFKSKGEEEKS